MCPTSTVSLSGNIAQINRNWMLRRISLCLERAMKQNRLTAAKCAIGTARMKNQAGGRSASSAPAREIGRGCYLNSASVGAPALAGAFY